MAEKETREQINQSFQNTMDDLYEQIETLPEKDREEFTEAIAGAVGSFTRILAEADQEESQHTGSSKFDESDEQAAQTAQRDELIGKVLLNLKKQLNTFEQKNAQLETELTEKEQTIKELKAGNTGIVKRPVGGVPGHPGIETKLVEGTQVSKVVECYPKYFTQEQIQAHEWTEGARHQVVDMVTVPYVTEYVQMETAIEGKHGRKVIEGKFPPQAYASISYGASIIRNVLIFHLFTLVSKTSISRILRKQLGITISVATVSTLLKRASERLFEASDKIARELNHQGHFQGSVFYLNEAKLEIDGEEYWDNIIVGRGFVHHCISKFRGLAGLYKSGILKGFAGTAVSSFWKKYVDKHFDSDFSWESLESELTTAASDDPQAKWIPMMQTFAKNSHLAYTEAEKENTIIPEDKLAELLDEYDKAVETGKKEDHMSEKSQTLLKHFEEHKTGIVAQLVSLQLSKTKDDGKRSYKLVKSKLNIAGRFKSVEDAEFFAAFRTVVDTANKQRVNPFEALDQVLGGNTGFLVTHNFDPNLSVTETSAPIMTIE